MIRTNTDDTDNALHWRMREFTHMHPHDWAFDVEESTLQTISISQIDSSHSRSPSPIFSIVIAFDGFCPKVPDITIAILTKANIDQEVAINVIWLEIRRTLSGGPPVDTFSEQGWRIPTSEGPRMFGFIIKGGTQRDDSFNLHERCLSIAV